MRSGSDNVVLLENGCVCCAVKGDLVKALDGLARGALKGELPPFDRCVIETSGLAEPTPVIEVLLSENTAHNASAPTTPHVFASKPNAESV